MNLVGWMSNLLRKHCSEVVLLVLAECRKISASKDALGA